MHNPCHPRALFASSLDSCSCVTNPSRRRRSAAASSLRSSPPSTSCKQSTGVGTRPPIRDHLHASILDADAAGRKIFRTSAGARAPLATGVLPTSRRPVGKNTNIKEGIANLKYKVTNSPVWNDLIKIKDLYLFGRFKFWKIVVA